MVQIAINLTKRITINQFMSSIRTIVIAVVCFLIIIPRYAPCQLLASSEFKVITSADITTGAGRMSLYLPEIKGKRVAIVANHASLVNKTLLPDTLLALGIKITKIFAPEHGFDGLQDAGAMVKDGKYRTASISIVSLYGEHNKPAPEDLKDVDVVLYDLQDVGVRFFTYITTLHNVMEACAENNKELIVLDRPDPNGYYVDGPVLDEKFKSMAGADPVPIVYGMTAGEYAQMLNGEKWLKNGEQCNLKCIPVEGYTHKMLYQLPVNPSPNLKDMTAVYLYPSLGLFEGTVISVGRGTDTPFEIIGAPELQNGTYSFTPESRPGATNPPYKGQKCSGYNLKTFGDIMIKNYQKLYLFWLKATYGYYPDKTKFFNSYFVRLAGNDMLQKQIVSGLSDEEIRKSWEPALSNFKGIRKKYLLYPDFK